MDAKPDSMVNSMEGSMRDAMKGSTRDSVKDAKEDSERESMPVSMADLTLNEFTELLSSKAPVPGGGGASALTGALAIALGHMVGSLTVGKRKYAGVEAEILRCNEQAEALRKRLLSLIDADAESFGPLAACYRMPAGTEEEKAHRQACMQKALQEACQAPVQIMDACLESLQWIGVYAEKGSVLALSDAAAAALLCDSALQAASLNIRINVKSMESRELAETYLKEMDHKLQQSGKLSAAIYEAALQRLACP